jgi:hypothetical protein
MTSAIGKLTNREKVIYRATTGIVCAVMIFSIINFIFNDHFPFPNGPEGAFVHLGLPQYFKIELTTAKILGVLAFSWLERAYKQRDPGITQFKCDSRLKDLRHDARFADLLKKMHLPA